MSLGNEGVPFTMPVQPANSGNGNNGGWGGDWGAWIILFLIFGMFGWGGFGGWGGGFGGNGGAQGALTRADLCSEFNFNGLESAVRGVQQGICDSTFALNNAITGGFNATQMGMMQGFNAQNVAYLQGQNALQAQLADCCCKTQSAIEGVKYTIAQEDCATRNLMQVNTRDIIDSQNAGTRAILDYLCQDKISTLQSENQALRLAASQSAQNATIGAMISASEATILRRTGAECPTPCYVVQPPAPVTFPTNCCGQANYAGNNGCGGCGC